jgi:lipoate-protein ligase A
VNVWRLIDSGPGPGPWNLALDEAIFAAVSRGESPPTLRFYGWAPPALSIGYAQDRDRDVDVAACRARGIDVLRRCTGGRAVLHDREVIYSVAAPAGDRLALAGLDGSCRSVAAALVAGLRALGVPAAVPPARPAGARAGRHPGCFASVARHEIEAGGRKIVGSAQRRAGGALLQHGSVLIEGHGTRLAALLRTGPGRAAPAPMAGIGEWLRPCPGYAPLVAALAGGFRAAWGVSLEPGAATPGEVGAARAFAAERYRSEAWNGRQPSSGEAARVDSGRVRP